MDGTVAIATRAIDRFVPSVHEGGIDRYGVTFLQMPRRRAVQR
jgi:hypothetical protein